MTALATHTRAFGHATAARIRAATAFSLALWERAGVRAKAQSMVEYAIIAALVAVVAIAAVRTLGTHVNQAFSNADTAFSEGR